MILPVRCYTCGKVLGNLTTRWAEHRERHLDDGWLPFFERYGIRRYCCRRVLMSQVPDPNHSNPHALPPSVVASKDKVGNMFLAR